MKRHLFRWLVPLPFDLPPIVWILISQLFWWFLFGSLCKFQTSFASAQASRARGTWGSGLRWQMSSMRGAVTSVQALNWLLAFMVGIVTPRPPCRAGRASKSLSKSVFLTFVLFGEFALRFRGTFSHRTVHIRKETRSLRQEPRRLQVQILRHQ